MNTLAPVPLFLVLVMGLCWTLVYIDGIRLSLLERTYAIPFWALALNIAWELLNTVFQYQAQGPVLQVWINGTWFLLDAVILYAYFRWGRRHFPKNMAAGWFVPWSLLALLTAFVVQYFFIAELGLFVGRAYAAFSQNLLMSVLFIAMLAGRGTSEGQSLFIAVNKLIGSLAATVLFGFVGAEGMPGTSALILALGTFSAVFDLIYIALLAGVKARERVGTCETADRLPAASPGLADALEVLEANPKAAVNPRIARKVPGQGAGA